MFKSKKAAPAPTIEERLAGAAAKKEAALSVFDGIVADLEEAAQEAADVQAMLSAEIGRLTAIFDAAFAEEIIATENAERIRATILGKA